MTTSVLAVLRHEMDDLPIQLFTQLPDESSGAMIRRARQFAKKIKPDDGGSVKRILRVDSSTPVSVYLYQFDIAGEMTSAELVTSFT